MRGGSWRAAIIDSGDPSRALIHEANSFDAGGWLAGNALPSDVAALAVAAPGVARAKDGAALVDAEFFHIALLVKRNNGGKGGTLVMGTGPHWQEMTPSFRLLSGRLPRRGTRELIAGTLASWKFSGLDAGSIDDQGLRWPVVGIFRVRSWWDGFLVGDTAVLKAATRRDADNLVRVRLVSVNAFDAFQHYVAARLPANVIVEREPDYYAHFGIAYPS